jgi:hypothetical protein
MHGIPLHRQRADAKRSGPVANPRTATTLGDSSRAGRVTPSQSDYVGVQLIVIELWADLASEVADAPSLTNIGNLDNPFFIV